MPSRHRPPRDRPSMDRPAAPDGQFRRLDAHKTNRKVVVTAVARELAGFVWAEMAT
jgi:hypothetical protein